MQTFIVKDCPEIFPGLTSKKNIVKTERLPLHNFTNLLEFNIIIFWSLATVWSSSVGLKSPTEVVTDGKMEKDFKKFH